MSELVNEAAKKKPLTLEPFLVGAVMLVAAALIPLVLPESLSPEEARVKQARDDIRAIRSALTGYVAEAGKLPTTEQGLGAVADPAFADGGILSGMPYLPKDPWGRDYVYRFPGLNAYFDILSLGPDGVESDDDVVGWQPY